MGCHTWVYIKLSALSEEQKQTIVQQKTQELENSFVINSSVDDIVQELEQLEPEDAQMILDGKTPQQYAEDAKKEITYRWNDLKNKGFNSKEIQNQKYNMNIRKFNGEKYYYLAFDTPFRIFGYPTEEFTDKEQLLNWLQKTHYRYGYYNGNYEFVEGYTEELVKRINDFFEKYDKNNEHVLHVHFG